MLQELTLQAHALIHQRGGQPVYVRVRVPDPDERVAARLAAELDALGYSDVRVEVDPEPGAPLVLAVSTHVRNRRLALAAKP